MASVKQWLGWSTLVALLTGLWFVLAAPADFQQGHMVKILYLHVPSAKMALLIYLIVTVASAIFLWNGSEKMDLLAESAASVGVAFSVVTLFTGSLWGKPMWGAWWAWDARLTSMLVLLIIYVGLIALRSAIEEPRRSARATAIMAIIGAVDLPIIHYSVEWWRTLHQPTSFGGAASSPAIVGALLPPLWVMSLAFLLLGIYMIVVKAQVIATERNLEQL